MVQDIVLCIASFNWILGLLLLVLSNASFIISKTSYERKGWKKCRMGYTIKEIREVIVLIDQDLIKEKLKKKKLFRKIGVRLKNI